MRIKHRPEYKIKPVPFSLSANDLVQTAVKIMSEKNIGSVVIDIDQVFKPQGVGVVIKSAHHCMSSRGVHKYGTDLITGRMLGCFRDNPMTRQEFMVHSRVEH